MTTSKKKRGKQRKAAKQSVIKETPKDNQDDDSNGIVFIPCDGGVIIHPDHKDRVASFIQSGNGSVTELLAKVSISNLSLVDSGVLSTVLVLLKRCDESFDNVVYTNIPGTLKSPSYWIDILSKAVEQDPSCNLQVTHNIGPLVRCMCNDIERLFFKSGKHWKEGIRAFSGLIANIVCYYTDDDERKIVIDTLLNYEGLLKSIVQWTFWNEEHRPDIANELKSVDEIASILPKVDDPITLTDIVATGKVITSVLIADPNNLTPDGFVTQDADKRFRNIGTTPIVNQDYNSNCIVSYVAGHIRQMKTGKDDDDFVVLHRLVAIADCVDKGVISEMIELGINFTYDSRRALGVADISRNMLLRWNSEINSSQPCDTRIAFAIRTGLVEMCLHFIERFREDESFNDKDEEDDSVEDSEKSLFCHIQIIFNLVYWLSLHKKTAKAIRHQKVSIEEELVRLQQNTSITNNIKCRELLEKIRAILELNGSYCCRCNKSLSRTEVMECNSCHRMAYCSRACQREDWLHGHKLTCNKPYAAVQAGQFQGRYLPETIPSKRRAAAKLKELEKNINMIQLKLFLDNAESILKQAGVLDTPLHDCVVSFDLRECPPTVEVDKYTDIYEEGTVEMKEFEDSRSKENITCDYYSYIINGEAEEDVASPRIVMQRLLPHEWLVSKKSK